jgi:hypothetical protein
MTSPAKVFTLHRYFIVADKMRHLFDRFHLDHPGLGVDSDDWTEASVFMNLWYGTLFVVVEGWRKLRLDDASVDACLARETMVRRLEAARNGTFHFKSKYWDDSQVSMPSG